MRPLFKWLPVDRTSVAARCSLLVLAQKRLIRVEDGGFDSFDASWRLPDKRFPYSCTDEEGAILFEVIVQNGLRSGFEIATAFGYSAAYAALGMKQTGGVLHSMDCYVEEWKEEYLYQPSEMKKAVEQVREKMSLGWAPSGLTMARSIAMDLGTNDFTKFYVGLSPDDVGHFIPDGIDYVLIDGGHFGDQPSIDFRAILPKISARCAIFFHDNNSNRSVEAAVRLAERELQTRAVRLSTRYSLTLVGRGLKPNLAQFLHSLCMRNYTPPVLSLSNARRCLCAANQSVRRLIRKLVGLAGVHDRARSDGAND